MKTAAFRKLFSEWAERHEAAAAAAATIAPPADIALSQEEGDPSRVAPSTGGTRGQQPPATRVQHKGGTGGSSVFFSAAILVAVVVAVAISPLGQFALWR